MRLTTCGNTSPTRLRRSRNWLGTVSTEGCRRACGSNVSAEAPVEGLQMNGQAYVQVDGHPPEGQDIIIPEAALGRAEPMVPDLSPRRWKPEHGSFAEVHTCSSLSLSRALYIYRGAILYMCVCMCILYICVCELYIHIHTILTYYTYILLPLPQDEARPTPARCSLRGGIYRFRGRGYGHSILTWTRVLGFCGILGFRTCGVQGFGF